MTGTSSELVWFVFMFRAPVLAARCAIEWDPLGQGEVVARAASGVAARRGLAGCFVEPEGGPGAECEWRLRLPAAHRETENEAEEQGQQDASELGGGGVGHGSIRVCRKT